MDYQLNNIPNCLRLKALLHNVLLTMNVVRELIIALSVGGIAFYSAKEFSIFHSALTLSGVFVFN